MMMALTPEFTPGQLVSGDVVSVSLMAPVARFSLRLRAADIPAVSTAIGVDLPTRIGACAHHETVEVMCLGPDEWQIQTDANDSVRLINACAAIYAQVPHSLTDISAREVTISIEGPGAVDLLSIGCPRDIDKIAIGTGCRTVFDGVSTVLWRDGETRFRLDIWRSFAPHVIGLIQTGCAELAAQ
ncbi:sarcosine oxidase subunit gamma [Thalassospira mesophila]|uniref:Sarcosine oxidase subunit gamma n=1 Tax=Thalassospira mesophila TaxID=1293891 RepID=A0A1Y2KX94_9PROT|nr:sarcosine oxidase subunit gamma family protein [Thalassospira mesophila]OSQ36732.1 sarcosine oxidase subunit gamma [Thalassospira mesophila]